MRNAMGSGCLVLLLGLAACSSGDDGTSEDADVPTDTLDAREDASAETTDEAGPADEASVEDLVADDAGGDEATVDDEASVEDAPGDEGYVVTPSGESCASAVVLHHGDVLTDQTTAGKANDVDTATMYGCAPDDGPDVVYVAHVPNMATLTVTATPETSYDLTANLIAGPASNCAATPVVCQLNSNVAGPGGVETLISINFSGHEQEVFVVVDGPTAADAGSFTLTAAIL
jgi:hypothetical protein